MAIKNLPDPIEISREVGAALAELSVPYFITGSMASSLVGEYRYTNDIDLVAALSEDKLDPFFERLRAGYYVPEDAARRAVGEGGSFNLIHMESVQKVDIFVSGGGSFDKEQMNRRRSVEVRPGVHLFFASSEDVVLNKLLWFKKSGSVSDRQWTDVLGVLRVQGENFDRAYAQRWSSSLGVDALLEKAIVDSSK